MAFQERLREKRNLIKIVILLFLSIFRPKSKGLEKMGRRILTSLFF